MNASGERALQITKLHDRHQRISRSQDWIFFRYRELPHRRVWGGWFHGLDRRGLSVLLFGEQGAQLPCTDASCAQLGGFTELIVYEFGKPVD